ncbi:uncharacterized protein LOC141528923 [Cotesia typhae]|uniref:uncharacterized protein LOC141528923 n=1 Tax=Cotesia typhae TaxID=2053667 RepID=UPI003D690EC7
MVDWPTMVTSRLIVLATHQLETRLQHSAGRTANKGPLLNHQASNIKMVNHGPTNSITPHVASYCNMLESSGLDRETAKLIPSSHPITSIEIKQALQFCMKETQRTHFHSELKMIKNQASWPKDHPFARLTAFLDTEGIIRVGGRLENAPDSDQLKHPAILPRDAALSKLIISDAHQRTMHGGTQLTLAYTRQRYWILGGRQPVRTQILKCLKCARHRGIRAQQLMGQLPAPNVTPGSAFAHTGVDYAGPVQIKTTNIRGSRTYKGWICVFVCLASSAVHLELVSNYSSSGFIAALHRFTSRRGLCTALYSDCGTTFQGACAELKRLFTQGTQESSEIFDALTVNEIIWHFNPQLLHIWVESGKQL